MTPYEKVFNVFLNKISDPIYGEMEEDFLTDDLIGLMNDAILHFEFPKVSLKDKDDESQHFNQELGFDEVQILGNLMVLSWVRRSLRDTDLIRQTMTPLEFHQYSQANHLNALISLERNLTNDMEELKRRYSRRIDNRTSAFQRLGR